jgi:hypothetical protein
MKKIIIVGVLVMAQVLGYAQSKQYVGAEIRTQESFLYGRFEVRMKSVEASGMLMSFFTFYDQPDFAQRWNEIDIEILGRYQNEVQFNAITGKHQMHEHRHVLDFNPHLDFHVYAFDWTPEYIAWSVDGKEVYRQTGEHIAKMNQQQKIMMNIWPSEFWEWTGPWDASKLPLHAAYDYVKYYEYTPKGSTPFRLSWEDQFDRIDYSRWSFGTHTFDGNASIFDPFNAYVKDGILYLVLSDKGAPVAKQSEEKPKGVLIEEALWQGNNKIEVKFANPVHLANAKKENFRIEGVKILKTRFSMDRTSVVLFLEPVGQVPEELLFVLPVPEGSKTDQKIKITE